MYKIIILFISFFVIGRTYSQDEIKIHSFKLKRPVTETKSNLIILTHTLSNSFKSCGDNRNIDKLYEYIFSGLNRKMRTKIFAKVWLGNFICFSSKSNSDSVGYVKVEEWTFNSCSNAKKVFHNFNKYKKMRLNPPPLAPMNWLIYLKDERVYVLSNDNFHRYPSQQSQYSKWIIDNLFDGKATEIIEIHK
jgi:hypothetical protein